MPRYPALSRAARDSKADRVSALVAPLGNSEVLPMIRYLVGILATVFLASFCPPRDDCWPDGTTNHQTCAKPITGCLCWFSSYTLTIWPGVDCAPCDFYFYGVFECTTGTIETHESFGDLACGHSVLIGWRCPCTGSNFYPVEVECGACP